MRFRLACLALLLAASPAFAVAPVAAIKAPSTAQTGPPNATGGGYTSGNMVLIQFQGSKGDRAPWIKGTGPGAVMPIVLFDAKQTPAFAVVDFDTPGVYTFYVITTGTRDGEKEPDVAVASCLITVTAPGQPAPTPTPTPAPGPGPTPTPVPPAPTPTPSVIPSTVHLNVIAVSGGMPNDPTELKFQAGYRDSTVSAQLAALNAEWRKWPATEKQIDANGLRPFLLDPAAGPSLLIYDDAGTIYDASGGAYATGSKDPKRKAFSAPATSAEVVALVKKLRGVQ